MRSSFRYPIDHSEWVKTSHKGWTHNRLRSERHVVVMNCSACEETESLLVWTAKRAYTKISTSSSPAANADTFKILSSSRTHRGCWRNIKRQNSAVNREKNVSRGFSCSTALVLCIAESRTRVWHESKRTQRNGQKSDQVEPLPFRDSLPRAPIQPQAADDLLLHSGVDRVQREERRSHQPSTKLHNTVVAHFGVA
jgi:hypothetical protein